MNKNTTLPPLIFLVVACVLALMVITQQPPANGWLEQHDSKSYILDGEPVAGWQKIDGTQYYFGDDYFLRTGWQVIDGNTYFFHPDGSMHTGWLEMDEAQYYLTEGGTLATGWQIINGKVYYFNTDGITVTGLAEIDGTTYLLGDQGLVTGAWEEIDDNLYYADGQGCPVTGWVTINGATHYFEETGSAANGWVELDGFAHYFYKNGAPAQGEMTLDGKLCRFASNGQLIILVNPWNYLPEDYTVELETIDELHQIAAIAYPSFLEMMEDCKAAGLEPAVCSAYRTHEQQDKLYQNRIARYRRAGYADDRAVELAGQSVAIPGTSEHQLGLALDIVDDNNWALDETQANTPTQKWLLENSWRYGWILRYPNEKSEITGIIYEPWHYRYVGKTIAKEIYESGLCLEEYLQMLTTSVG